MNRISPLLLFSALLLFGAVAGQTISKLELYGSEEDLRGGIQRSEVVLTRSGMRCEGERLIVYVEATESLEKSSILLSLSLYDTSIPRQTREIPIGEFDLRSERELNAIKTMKPMSADELYEDATNPDFRKKRVAFEVNAEKLMGSRGPVKYKFAVEGPSFWPNPKALLSVSPEWWWSAEGKSGRLFVGAPGKEESGYERLAPNTFRKEVPVYLFDGMPEKKYALLGRTTSAFDISEKTGAIAVPDRSRGVQRTKYENTQSAMIEIESEKFAYLCESRESGDDCPAKTEEVKILGSRESTVKLKFYCLSGSEFNAFSALGLEDEYEEKVVCGLEQSVWGKNYGQKNKIGAKDIQSFAKALIAEGREKNIDPIALVAIAERESGMATNPSAGKNVFGHLGATDDYSASEVMENAVITTELTAYEMANYLYSPKIGLMENPGADPELANKQMVCAHKMGPNTFKTKSRSEIDSLLSPGACPHAASWDKYQEAECEQ